MAASAVRRASCTARNPSSTFENHGRGLDHVLEVAASVDPSRQAQAGHFVGRRDVRPAAGIDPPEDEGTEPDCPDAGYQVQLAGQRVGWQPMGRNVWQQPARVDVDGVAADGLQTGSPALASSSPNQLAVSAR